MVNSYTFCLAILTQEWWITYDMINRAFHIRYLESAAQPKVNCNGTAATRTHVEV